MKIVIINGTGGAGKDTFVTMCKDILGSKYVYNISTVDFVKEVATLCGWNGTKTPKNRKFLSDLKDLLTEWDDIPIKKVMAHTVACVACAEFDDTLDKSVVFIHCREPKEIDKLLREFKGEATTLLIRRSEAEAVEQINHADNDVLNYSYDYTIYNDSTLSWLRNEAVVFLRDYLGFNV